MRRFVIGGLFIAVVGFMAFTYLKPKHDKYVVYATFKDAAGILKNYNVKVGQIPAGQVTDIKLDKHDNAVVRMKMDSGAYPIGAGATAAVRPVNLLGEKYIDLSPGDLKHPLKSGTMIPITKTSEPIELDDALNTLDPDTRMSMRILINEAGLAMAGNGANFNQTLSDLPSALDKANQVVSEADAENAQLKTVIDSGDRDLAAVNAKRDDFKGMIRSAGNALETAAQRRAQLGATVDTAPAAINQLRNTLGTLQGTSEALIPTADDVVHTAPSLNDTLSRLPGFADDADSTLKEVKSVSPALSKLGRRATPTLKLLKPTMQRLNQFSSDIGPLVDSLDSQGKDATGALLNFINGWAGVTDDQDNLGHNFRLRLTLDSTAITTALQRFAGSDTTPIVPRKKTTAKPAASAAPATAAPATTSSTTTSTPAAPAVPPVSIPDPAKVVQDATDAVKGVIGGVTGAVTGQKQQPPPAAPSSSGSSSDPSKLLNYLLGS